jgi:hypothetical protein
LSNINCGCEKNDENVEKRGTQEKNSLSASTETGGYISTDTDKIDEGALTN